MSEPWQHYYQSQRLKLSFWSWGDAGAPPLILVHGGRDTARSWDRIAEAFQDDYHVIACDLRGHGDSAWATGSFYSLSEFVLDLIALIDLVGGRARVVSHSLGAAIAMLAAGAFPEKFDRLVEIEGAGARIGEAEVRLTPQYFREWVMQNRALEQQTPRVYPTFKDTVARLRKTNQNLSQEMAEHLARWATNGIDGGYVWKFDPWVRARAAIEIRPEEMVEIWRNMDCPILHLIGERSHFFSRGAFRGLPIDSYFRNSRTQVMADASHWMHHDQAAMVVQAIRDFLGAPPPRHLARLAGD